MDMNRKQWFEANNIDIALVMYFENKKLFQ